jgi:hypothetical protein
LGKGKTAKARWLVEFFYKGSTHNRSFKQRDLRRNKMKETNPQIGQLKRQSIWTMHSQMNPQTRRERQNELWRTDVHSEITAKLGTGDSMSLRVVDPDSMNKKYN